MLVVASCKESSRSGGAGVGEQEFVEDEVAKIEAGLRAKDETAVMVGCMVAAGKGLERMPAALQRKIEKLCYADVPRLHLELAIADATKARAEHPDHPAMLACAQLHVSDALKAMARAPRPDPGLQKLAADYEKLCPEAIAKIRERAGDGSP
jgi:hypothetical protein